MKDSPRVFISSTYYDLKQLRQDLSQSLIDLGLTPLASEFDSFPVNPDIRAIENCIEVVKAEADVFILIVGKRYGYVDTNNDKSVTNLEYIAATSKGIPVFVFVDRELISAIPFYKQNPEADFTNIVDNKAVFDFVINIREREGRWVFSFDTAQDVVKNMKTQFARLLMDGLSTRALLVRPDTSWLTGISAKAFTFATVQNTGWEYLLFAQVLHDAVSELKSLRFQQQLGIIDYRRVERIDTGQFFQFAGNRISELDAIVASCKVIFDKMLPQAMRESGVPASAEEICLAARQLASLYRSMLDWSLAVQACLVPSKLKPLLYRLAHSMEETLTAIEEFGPKSIQQVEEALLVATKDSPAVLDLTLTFGIDEGLADAIVSIGEEILANPESFSDDD